MDDSADTPPKAPVQGPVGVQPHCPECGYNLAGMTAGARLRCPECGRRWRRSDLSAGPPNLGWPNAIRNRFRRCGPRLRLGLLSAHCLSPAIVFTAGEIWPEHQTAFRNVAVWGGPAAVYGWACLWLWVRGMAWWGLFAVPFALAAVPANVVAGVGGAFCVNVVRLMEMIGLGIAGWLIVGGLVGAVLIFLITSFAYRAESDIPLDDYNPEP